LEGGCRQFQEASKLRISKTGVIKLQAQVTIPICSLLSTAQRKSQENKQPKPCKFSSSQSSIWEGREFHCALTMLTEGISSIRYKLLLGEFVPVLAVFLEKKKNTRRPISKMNRLGHPQILF